MKITVIIFAFILLFTVTNQAQIPAFPGAQGFGTSTTTGGRNGQVIYVTTLNCDGLGSLKEALNTPGAKYILFKVSGIIDCAAEIEWGDCYIAGQTSPGGITVRGILLDDYYEPTGKAQNVIIRHLNSRPNTEQNRPGTGWVLDDALRFDGAKNIVVDHCSLANAVDECVQISRSSEVTVSNCMLAETLGEHFNLGGMLINYSTAAHKKDNISIHHNVWNRIGGRMPEITCEESGETQGDQTCLTSPFHFEWSNNLLWDIQIQIFYSQGFSPSNTNDYHDVLANFVGNRAVARPSYCGPFFNFDLLNNPDNQLFTNGNSMNLYPTQADYDLFFCCNDFCLAPNNPNLEMGTATQSSTRHSYPSLDYTPSDNLLGYIAQHVGAFNNNSPNRRDPMNRRLLQPLQSQIIASQPIDGEDYFHDAFTLDFVTPPTPPIDTDNDGMPDSWESQYGLNPNIPDHNGTQLSVPFTGIAGYSNLECYLNDLSDRLVNGTVAAKEPEVTDWVDVHFDPIGKMLNIKVANENWTNTSLLVQLLDTTGKTVRNESFRTESTQMPLYFLPTGVYFLKLRLGLKLKTLRVFLP